MDRFQGRDESAWEEMAGDIQELLEERSRPRVMAANRWAVVANVDGRITGGDVFVCMIALMAFLTAGLVVSLALVLSGEPWRSASDWLKNFAVLGAVLVAVRLGLDLLDFYSFWDASFGRLMARLADRPEPEMRTVEMLRPVTVRGRGVPSLPPPPRLLDLPNGRSIEFKLFERFAREAVAQGDTAWSREHWCNQPDNPDRPGLALMGGRQWSGVRILFERHGLWRTRDAQAVEDFLEALDGEFGDQD